MRRLLLLFLFCPLAANNPGGSIITPQVVIELTGIDLRATLEGIAPERRTSNMVDCLFALHNQGIIDLALVNHVLLELPDFVTTDTPQDPPMLHYHGAGDLCAQVSTSTVICCTPGDVRNMSLVEWLTHNLK
jgi:hypothetical protein